MFGTVTARLDHATAKLRRMFLTLVIAMTVLAPVVDLAEDEFHPDSAQTLVQIVSGAPSDHGSAPGGHSDGCGPVSICSLAAVLAPDAWFTQDTTTDGNPLAARDVHDLWAPDPNSPVPIVLG